MKRDSMENNLASRREWGVYTLLMLFFMKYYIFDKVNFEVKHFVARANGREAVFYICSPRGLLLEGSASSMKGIFIKVDPHNKTHIMQAP